MCRSTIAHHRLPASFVLAALGLSVILVSCADHVDGAVRLRLRVILETSDGLPVPAAKVWVKARHPGLRKQPHVLEQPICVTDGTGVCSAVIAYRFGFASWPWRRFLPGLKRAESGRTSPDLFELTAEKDDLRVPLGFLPALTSAELYGYEEVVFQIKAPGLR